MAQMNKILSSTSEEFIPFGILFIPKGVRSWNSAD